jgi:hypothetical protein
MIIKYIKQISAFGLFSRMAVRAAKKTHFEMFDTGWQVLWNWTLICITDELKKTIQTPSL